MSAWDQTYFVEPPPRPAAPPVDYPGFGPALKRVREARGLSQRALAAASGCALTTVTRLERSSRNPSRQMLERLITALDLPPRQANRLRMSAGFAARD